MPGSQVEEQDATAVGKLGFQSPVRVRLANKTVRSFTFRAHRGDAIRLSASSPMPTAFALLQPSSSSVAQAPIAQSSGTGTVRLDLAALPMTGTYTLQVQAKGAETLTLALDCANADASSCGASGYAEDRCMTLGECANGFYCQYAAGVCGPGPQHIDATGSCEPAPVQCPAASQPVCGCDGHTYANPCAAAAAAVSLANPNGGC